MRQYIEHLRNAVTSWPGVTANPHRFGGIEFNLPGVEIGHVHLNGMVDIPFNSKIHDQLIAEGRAELHHFLKDTGWISFYIRSETDVEKAIWLFKLSYLFNATRGTNRTTLQSQVNINSELDTMALSQPLRAIFHRLTHRVATE